MKPKASSGSDLDLVKGTAELDQRKAKIRFRRENGGEGFRSVSEERTVAKGLGQRKRKRSHGKTKKDKDYSKRTDVLFTGEVIYRCFWDQICPRSLFKPLGIRNLELWTSKCVLLKLEGKFGPGSAIVEYVKTIFNIFPCPSTQRSSRCFRCIIHQECSFHVAAVSADNIWRPFKKDPDFGGKVPVYLWSGKGKMYLFEN